MLVRKGGMSLRGLTVISPPDKTEYIEGDTVDMDGAIIGAEFGRVTVPLHETAWTYSPTSQLTSLDTAVTITAAFGAVSKSCTVPITVNSISRTLNDNTWERIAYAARTGIASSMWSVGDVKYDTVGSTQYAFKLISFNADALDTTDAMYSDPGYNGGTKKAAMVFQVFTSPLTAPMHTPTTTDRDWENCAMRTFTLAGLYGTLPADLRAAIRTVKKYTYHGYTGYTGGKYTADKLFLPSTLELFSNVSDSGATYERGKVILYTYYANGGAFPGQADDYAWTRTSHSPSCNQANHYYAVTGRGDISGSASGSQHYYPMFCI